MEKIRAMSTIGERSLRELTLRHFQYLIECMSKIRATYFMVQSCFPIEWKPFIESPQMELCAMQPTAINIITRILSLKEKVLDLLISRVTSTRELIIVFI